MTTTAADLGIRGTAEPHELHVTYGHKLKRPQLDTLVPYWLEQDWVVDIVVHSGHLDFLLSAEDSRPEEDPVRERLLNQVVQDLYEMITRFPITQALPIT
ncbi:MAG TPA: hypothetical protein VLE72_03500 [Candidatus Saccharimonadales bacterium]|nr:hypothetical protein [Candidatus Saccharimonadales bacterium]